MESSMAYWLVNLFPTPRRRRQPAAAGTADCAGASRLLGSADVEAYVAGGQDVQVECVSFVVEHRLKQGSEKF